MILTKSISIFLFGASAAIAAWPFISYYIVWWMLGIYHALPEPHPMWGLVPLFPGMLFWVYVPWRQLPETKKGFTHA